MYPLRNVSWSRGKRALLAFFTEGRYRASHPKAALGHPLGGAGVCRANLSIHPLQKPPVYKASAELVASLKVEEQDASGTQLIRPIIVGMERREAALVHSRPVAEETIQRLGLRMEPGDLLENLTVERVGRIAVIELSYKDTDRQRAQKIVYTVGEVASERMSILSARNDVTVFV
jgi:uncharacterized protein involved in exopolysaccharide biosynthesis